MIKIFVLLLSAIIVAIGSADGKRWSLDVAAAKPHPIPKPVKPKDQLKQDWTSLKALVKYAGTGAVGISGKIAGTVFTNAGSAGAFIRVWAKPKNARTALQQFVRGVLSGISSSFRSLTPSEIDAWNSAATSTNGNALRVNVFGDSKVVTGSQLYQRINNILLAIGASVVTSPPVVATTDSILSATPASSAGGGTFTLALVTFGGATTVPANTTAVLEATPQLSNGRNFFGKSQYRQVGIYAAATNINPLNIASDYIAKFGTLVAGSKVGLRIRFVFNDTGEFGQSGAVYATATIGA